MIGKKQFDMRKQILILWTWPVILLLGCQENHDLMLSKNGIASASIVLPDQPDEWEQKAATALQSYFKKIGEVDMPIVKEATGKTHIYVGKPTNLRLAKEAIENYGERV